MAKTAGSIHQTYHVKWNFGLLFVFLRWITVWQCFITPNNARSYVIPEHDYIQLPPRF